MSKNAIGLIALIIAAFGLDVPAEAIGGAWEGITAIIALVLMIWNQLARKDVKLFLLKK